jgi:hypothetical protein
MLGRSDLKEYNNMCQQVLNTIILKQGGGTRRPGTQYGLSKLHDTVSGFDVILDANTRILPFVFSNGEAYLLIIFNYSNIGATTLGWGMVMYNVATGVITNPANGVSGFWVYPAYTTLAQMRKVRVAQSGDVLSIVDGANYPYFIIRTGTDAFTITDIFNARTVYTSLRQPYGGSNTNISSLLSPSAVPAVGNIWDSIPWTPLLTNTGQTMAVSATTVGGRRGVTWANPATSQYPDGTFIRVDAGGTTGIGVLYTHTGTQTLDIYRAFPDTAAHTFQISMWGPSLGYPATNLFYQQRLIYANTTQFPDTLWGSQQGDYMLINSARTLDDVNLTTLSNDRPFQFTIAEDKIAQILWLKADVDLYMGTNSDEWIAQGSDGSSSLGPINIGFAKQTSYGSEPVQAISSDGAVQFVQRGGGGLREIVYVFQQNHRLANPLSDWAEHLVRKGLNLRASYTQPKICEVAYQSLENNITWCLDTNGCLFGLTRDRASGVMAWHWHQLGGEDNVSGGYSEIPTVLSICSTPSSYGDSDDLWMVVQRYINGAEVVYLEKMGKAYRFNSMVNSSTNIQDKIVLADCAVLQRLGSPGNTFNGFAHLPNTQLDVLADGNYLGLLTTNGSGVLTLPGPTTYTEVIAGLPYQNLIQPMPEVGGALQGTGDSSIKRIDKLKIRFERTVAAMYGKVNDASLMPIAFRDTSVPNGTPTPMFTGVIEKYYGGEYEFDADLIIASSVCLPFTLTSIAVKGLTYEG